MVPRKEKDLMKPILKINEGEEEEKEDLVYSEHSFD